MAINKKTIVKAIKSQNENLEDDAIVVNNLGKDGDSQIFGIGVFDGRYRRYGSFAATSIVFGELIRSGLFEEVEIWANLLFRVKPKSSI